ncbi:unnamed protein product [Ectocarpus fasciculatus]
MTSAYYLKVSYLGQPVRCARWSGLFHSGCIVWTQPDRRTEEVSNNRQIWLDYCSSTQPKFIVVQVFLCEVFPNISQISACIWVRVVPPPRWVGLNVLVWFPGATKRE